MPFVPCVDCSRLRSLPPLCSVPSAVDGRLRLPSRAALLAKRAISDVTRFVFVAGLEGSGHHAWRDAFAGCTDGDGDGSPCRFACGLATLLSGGSDDAQRGKLSSAGLFHQPGNSSRAAALRLEVMQELRRLASPSAAARPALYLLNLGQTPGAQVGMMSFPNWGAGRQRGAMPDLVELSTLAEAAGADLRVLLLTRPAAEMLASTSEHRRFATPARQAAVLTAAAHALDGQLHRIDSRFVFCVDTRRAASTRHLASFLHPALARGGTAEAVWQAALRLIRQPPEFSNASRSSPPPPAPPPLPELTALSEAVTRLEGRCERA